MYCTCYIRGSARPLSSWRVTWREYTPFGYSRVKCYICGCEWITRADYVRRTPDAEAEGQRRIAFARQCVECVMLNECQAQGPTGGIPVTDKQTTNDKDNNGTDRASRAELRSEQSQDD